MEQQGKKYFSSSILCVALQINRMFFFVIYKKIYYIELSL